MSYNNNNNSYYYTSDLPGITGLCRCYFCHPATPPLASGLAFRRSCCSAAHQARQRARLSPAGEAGPTLAYSGLVTE